MFANTPKQIDLVIAVGQVMYDALYTDRETHSPLVKQVRAILDKSSRGPNDIPVLVRDYLEQHSESTQ